MAERRGDMVLGVGWTSIGLVAVSLAAGFSMGLNWGRSKSAASTGRRSSKTAGERVTPVASGCSKRQAKRQARRKRWDEARGLGDCAKEGREVSAKEGKARLMRGRKRTKGKPCLKDLALDAFVKVAAGHLPDIGQDDYDSVLLLPREIFLATGKFIPHEKCQGSLLTLGQARATTGADLRVLYISCAWSSACGGLGVNHGLELGAEGFTVAAQLLGMRKDLNHVWVGCSCLVGEEQDPQLRARQLRHVPLVLLRCDAFLALPLLAESTRDRQRQHTDLKEYLGSAWSRLELCISQVGQATAYVSLRAGRLSVFLEELASGKETVGQLAIRAAGKLEAAVAEAASAAAAELSTGTGSDGDVLAGEDSIESAAAARENWLGADGNPLSALQKAKDVVVAAEHAKDPSLLAFIGTASKVPDSAAVGEAREALGYERHAGERELALSLLLFTVACAQCKGRSSYTDGFTECTTAPEVTYRPVGVVRSPYRERFGTPRQPQVTTGVLQGGALPGKIVFFKGCNYEEALQDLEGFDLVWVISHMHLNKGWNAKVRPPRLPEERKGLFSTRSPHRPNPLALSSLRVTKIDAAGGVIHVEGLDLLDGTPVLDIKPYIKYCDSFPDARAGWLDELGEDHEVQGDFLPKFSIGAALVHTASAVEVEYEESGAGSNEI